jgi:hypothetical protein
MTTSMRPAIFWISATAAALSASSPEVSLMDVGVLGREILQRLSSGIPCSGKDNRVWARRDGGGESIANATVRPGNCTRYCDVRYIPTVKAENKTRQDKRLYRTFVDA